MTEIIKILGKYVHQLTNSSCKIITTQIIKTIVAKCSVGELVEALESYTLFKSRISQAYSSLGLVNMRSFTDQCAIGKGGFGRVYKATHCINGKEYAIKEMSKARILRKKNVRQV